jgi:hypothetical protein
MDKFEDDCRNVDDQEKADDVSRFCGLLARVHFHCRCCYLVFDS